MPSLTMDHTKIGARIRAARNALGLSQIDLHEKTGIAQSTISRLEAGKLELTLAQAYSIAKVCKLKLDDLTSGAA